MPHKKYQTISEFMMSPFGIYSSMEKNNKYEALYENFVKSNKIYIAGFTNIEDSYYVHIKIPSESQKDGKYEYDVVIRFFTDKPALRAGTSLRAYYMQFFSNSPGFIYRYAALYKKEDYLIKALYDKLDPEYSNVMPTKTNADMELSYDKSIYFACKFLSEGRFRYLTKVGLLLHKKKTPQKFFSDISDFKAIKFDQELMNVEKKLKKDLDSGKIAEERKDRKKLHDLNKKQPEQSTLKDKSKPSITRKPKITGGGHKKTKIVARKTTKKT